MHDHELDVCSYSMTLVSRMQEEVTFHIRLMPLGALHEEDSFLGIEQGIQLNMSSLAVHV